MEGKLLFIPRMQADILMILHQKALTSPPGLNMCLTASFDLVWVLKCSYHQYCMRRFCSCLVLIRLSIISHYDSYFYLVYIDLKSVLFYINTRLWSAVEEGNFAYLVSYGLIFWLLSPRRTELMIIWLWKVERKSNLQYFYPPTLDSCH